MDTQFTATIGASLAPNFNSTIKKAGQSLRQLKRSSLSIGRGFEAANKTGTQLIKTVASLSSSTVKLGTSTLRLSKYQTSTIKTTGTLINRLSALKKQQDVMGDVKASQTPNNFSSNIKRDVDQLKSLKTTVLPLGNAFKSANSNGQRFNKTINKLGLSSSNTETSISRLRTSVSSLNTDLIATKRSTSQLIGQLETLHTRQAVNRNLRGGNRQNSGGRTRSSDRMNDLALGAAGAGTIGMGIKKGFASIIKEGIAFEKSLLSSLAIARDFGEEGENRFDNLSQAHESLTAKIKNLGETTAFTMVEVADASKYLTMAGFKIPDVIDMLPDTLALANAGELGVARTADIMSNIMKPFKMSAKDTQKVTDILSQTIISSNVDISMLGETMKYAAGPAKALGLSLAETAAMAGIMGNSGIQGSMAGTSLRQMSLRSLSGAKPARDALKVIGTSFGEIEASGATTPIEVMREIALAAEKSGRTGRQVLETLKDVYGVTAVSGVQAVFNEMAKSEGVGISMSGALDAYISKIENVQTGLTKDIAAFKLDGLGGDVKLAQSAMSGVKINTFEIMKNDLRALTTSFTGFTLSVNDWVKANPEQTKSILRVAAAIGVIAVAGASLSAGMLIWSAVAMGYGAVFTGIAVAVTATSGAIGRAMMTMIAMNTTLKFQIGMLAGNAVAWSSNALASLMAAPAALAARIGIITTSIRAQSIALAIGTGNWIRWVFAANGGMLGAIAGKLTLMRNAILGVSAASMMTGGLVLLKGAFTALLFPIKAIGMALIANPIGLIVMGIALAGAALYKYWIPITGMFSAMGAEISAVVAPAWNMLKASVAPIAPLFDWIGRGLSAVWTWITQIIAPLDETSTEFGAMSEAGKSVGHVIGVIIAGAFKLLAGTITGAIAGIKSFISYASKAAEWTGGKITAGWNGAKNLVGMGGKPASKESSQPSTKVSGQRSTGGVVNSGKMYEVAEHGIPELLSVGTKTLLMMGGMSGYVTPFQTPAINPSNAEQSSPAFNTIGGGINGGFGGAKYKREFAQNDPIYKNANYSGIVSRVNAPSTPSFSDSKKSSTTNFNYTINPSKMDEKENKDSNKKNRRRRRNKRDYSSLSKQCCPLQKTETRNYTKIANNNTYKTKKYNYNKQQYKQSFSAFNNESYSKSTLNKSTKSNKENKGTKKYNYNKQQYKQSFSAFNNTRFTNDNYTKNSAQFTEKSNELLNQINLSRKSVRIGSDAPNTIRASVKREVDSMMFSYIENESSEGAGTSEISNSSGGYRNKAAHNQGLSGAGGRGQYKESKQQAPRVINLNITINANDTNKVLDDPQAFFNSVYQKFEETERENFF